MPQAGYNRRFTAGGRALWRIAAGGIADRRVKRRDNCASTKHIEAEERMAAKQATASCDGQESPRSSPRRISLKAPEKDYMNEAQLAFFKQRLIELRDQLLQNADDTGEHLRENEITTDPSGPRDARGGIHARAAHARPRAQAAQEGREVDQADRRRQLRLLRGDRRADRHSAAARAADGDAVARSAGAPRARAEALRRRLTSGRGRGARASSPRGSRSSRSRPRAAIARTAPGATSRRP